MSYAVTRPDGDDDDDGCASVTTWPACDDDDMASLVLLSSSSFDGSCAMLTEGALLGALTVMHPYNFRPRRSAMHKYTVANIDVTVPNTMATIPMEYTLDQSFDLSKSSLNSKIRMNPHSSSMALNDVVMTPMTSQQTRLTDIVA